MSSPRVTTVVFDFGGVLVDWNPRYLYRKLFNGDEAGMERFLATVCSPDWNEHQDAGRSVAEAVAEATGYRGDILWDSSKPDGTPKKQLDVSRLAALGWRARIPLAEGLRSTVTLFREQLALEQVRL